MQWAILFHKTITKWADQAGCVFYSMQMFRDAGFFCLILYHLLGHCLQLHGGNCHIHVPGGKRKGTREAPLLVFTVQTQENTWLPPPLWWKSVLGPLLAARQAEMWSLTEKPCPATTSLWSSSEPGFWWRASRLPFKKARNAKKRSTKVMAMILR